MKEKERGKEVEEVELTSPGIMSKDSYLQAPEWLDPHLSLCL